MLTELFNAEDLIVYDLLCHNSIAQGIKFSGAKSISYPHNDYVALEKILMSQTLKYRKILIVTEGVFSMDGDIPDVKKLIHLKKKYQCFLMIDEAHSIGTLGKTGAGIREHYAINANDVDIWMGTLSKSFASCGGYIAGSAELITHLKYFACSFVYSAGISPANTAAALTAIHLMLQEPQRVQILQHNSTFLLSLLQKANIATGESKHAPIIPIILGDTATTLAFATYLQARNIYAIPIVYPAVPQNSSRVRLFISAQHTQEQLSYTADTIIDYFKNIQAVNN